MRPIDSGRIFSRLRVPVCSTWVELTGILCIGVYNGCHVGQLLRFRTPVPERHRQPWLLQPLLPERIEWERRRVGARIPGRARRSWRFVADPDADLPNIVRIYEKHAELIEGLHRRLLRGFPPRRRRAWPDYEALVARAALPALLSRTSLKPTDAGLSIAGVPCRLGTGFSSCPKKSASRPPSVPRTCSPASGQLQRAFHYIFYNIIGSSMPAAGLRAAIWQSVFTRDMRRYRRTLYEKMGDFPTPHHGTVGDRQGTGRLFHLRVSLYPVRCRAPGVRRPARRCHNH